MTPEDLRAARIAEATRRYASDKRSVLEHLMDIYETNWTPPETVDPDLLAAEEYAATTIASADPSRYATKKLLARAYLAGCTCGREGTKGLVEAAEALIVRWDGPLWKDAPHTAYYIDGLRKALASAKRGG